MVVKNQLLNRSACICDLLFRTRTLKSSNWSIKTFKNSSKSRGGGGGGGGGVEGRGVGQAMVIV